MKKHLKNKYLEAYLDLFTLLIHCEFFEEPFKLDEVDKFIVNEGFSKLTPEAIMKYELNLDKFQRIVIVYCEQSLKVPCECINDIIYSLNTI